MAHQYNAKTVEVGLDATSSCYLLGAAAPAKRPERHLRKTAVDTSSPARLQVPTTDFLRKNALAAIKLRPPKSEAQFQDYLAKEEYGRVPEYLQQNKLRMETERQEQQALTAAKTQKVGLSCSAGN